MSSTRSKKIVDGKWPSTTLLAGACLSTEMWPTTGKPSTSAATRRAPIPSNRPMVKTVHESISSGRSPRTGISEAACPQGVRPTDLQSPPPVVEASLAVTHPRSGHLKSILARGISRRNRYNSHLTFRGKTCRNLPGPSPKHSMNSQTAFNPPSKGLRNMLMYTSPPATTWASFWVATPLVRRLMVRPMYLEILSGFGAALPSSPFTRAPCTSACVDLATAFLGWRGTPSSAYMAWSPKVWMLGIPAMIPAAWRSTFSSSS